MRTIAFVAALNAAIFCLLSGNGQGMLQAGPDDGPAATGRIYYVDGSAASASDSNPGTESKPWKTLLRAGKAKELKPGDTVLIRAGVYRQSIDITVSGEPGKPITFAAAPGEQVIIKGSEILAGNWTQVSKEPDRKEPYPNAYQRIWKIKLGEKYFNDPGRPDAFKDKSKRDVTQLVVGDRYVLQKIGPTIGSQCDESTLAPLGRSVNDLSNMREGTFFYQPDEQTLYLKTGSPSEGVYELGVRGDILQVVKAHDVVIRGLEVRHTRGNMASMSECQRVTIEDCKLTLADFCNLALYTCKNCLVRRCDLSWAANTGFHLGSTTDCTIEDCTLTFNNYRQYGGGWHDGGMKNISSNRRTTIRRCELAYNFSLGIWHDTANVDIRILDNVIHHNRGLGIFHELNFGGGVFAGNLIFANGNAGIAVATHYPRYMVKRHWVEEAKAAAAKGEEGWAVDSPRLVAELGGVENIPDGKLWIVNNTLAGNLGGIALADRYGTWENLQNICVLNNLFLHNYTPGEPAKSRYADLRFMMHADANDKRFDTSNHTDYNVFAAPAILNPGSNGLPTLQQWQQRFNEDLHSRVLPLRFEVTPTGFRLLAREGLDIAGPLPEAVTSIWKPKHPERVGADLTEWP